MTADRVLGLSIAEDLAAAIERGGGTIALAGENIKLFLPGDLSNLLPELKEHKPELVALLHRRGMLDCSLPVLPEVRRLLPVPEGERWALRVSTVRSSGN